VQDAGGSLLAAENAVVAVARASGNGSDALRQAAAGPAGSGELSVDEAALTHEAARPASWPKSTGGNLKSEDVRPYGQLAARTL
jgi:hypothetical protein